MIGSIGYDRGHTVGVKVRVRITDISELGVRVRARVAARVGIQDLSGLALVWVIASDTYFYYAKQFRLWLYCYL